MAYQRIRVEPIAAALGAEVSGVDLRQTLDDATMREIHDAWMQHQVLFFRSPCGTTAVRSRRREYWVDVQLAEVPSEVLSAAAD